MVIDGSNATGAVLATVTDAPRLNAGPPSSCVAMRRELLMAAHPKISPPHARFWKQAARIMAIRGALGFVMAAAVAAGVGVGGWMQRGVSK